MGEGWPQPWHPPCHSPNQTPCTHWAAEHWSRGCASESPGESEQLPLLGPHPGQTKIGVDLSELLKQPRRLYTQPERSVHPHPLFNPQSTSSSQSQPGQRGVQPIHGNPRSMKTRSRSKLFKVKNLGANWKEPRGSEEEGMNITLLINKYLLFTRHKVRNVSVERRKLTRWDQVIVGDSDLSLNTRSEAKAIQAHHRFWLFPPNSHRTQKKWLGGEAPIQDRWRATQHLSPTAQPVPAGATILKELARLAALPPWQDTKGPRLTGFTPPYPLKNTDPFHLTDVRRGPIWGKEYSSGLGKPRVRVPALQCPSWRTFLLPSLTKSITRPLLTRLLGCVPSTQHSTGPYCEPTKVHYFNPYYYYSTWKRLRQTEPRRSKRQGRRMTRGQVFNTLTSIASCLDLNVQYSSSSFLFN